jgi:hypothetical protein
MLEEVRASAGVTTRNEELRIGSVALGSMGVSGLAPRATFGDGWSIGIQIAPSQKPSPGGPKAGAKLLL